jgi:hypothetical protein
VAFRCERARAEPALAPTRVAIATKGGYDPARTESTFEEGVFIMRFTLAGVAVILATVLTAAAASAATSPQTVAKPTTFHLVEIDHSFKLVDNPPKLKSRNDFFSAGDTFVFSSELRTPAGKHAGWLDAQCTVVTGGKAGTTTCQGAFRLGGGSLIAAATTGENDAVTNVAILGGTGVYAGMRGQVRSVTVGGQNSNRSNDTFTLWK